MVKLGRGGAGFSRWKDCLREHFRRTSRRCLQTEASPGLESSSFFLFLIILKKTLKLISSFHLHRSGHASLELLKSQEHDTTKLSCLNPLISDIQKDHHIFFLICLSYFHLDEENKLLIMPFSCQLLEILFKKSHCKICLRDIHSEVAIDFVKNT